MSTATRRQSHSCDQCRRSKRRCAFSPSDKSPAPKSCIICTRVGNVCTFEFANSQSNKKGKLRWPQDNVEEQPTKPRTSEFIIDAIGGDQNTTSGIRTDEDLFVADELCFMEVGDMFDKDWLDYGTHWPEFDIAPNTASSCSRGTNSLVDHAVGTEKSGPVHKHPQNILRTSRSRSTAAAVGTPMQLLNASVVAVTINSILASLYDNVLAGASSRFLNYSCTIARGMRLYCLEDRNPLQWRATVPPQHLSHGLNSQDNYFSPARYASGHAAEIDVQPAASHTLVDDHSRLPATYLDPRAQITTLLGVVRFLDHFSELYGNKLAATARKESEEVLASVIQVISMQWLAKFHGSALAPEKGSLYDDSLRCGDLSDPGISAFLGAWFRARSGLLKAHSTRSFVMIYAIFLFNMTVRPTGLSATMTDTGKPHEFLDEALAHLCVLENLIQKYCRVLGSTSSYAKAMRSCLNMMRWFGYIRDTVSSFTDSRTGVLPNFMGSHEGIVQIGSPSAFDEDLENISVLNIQEKCRVMMFHIFRNWRRIIRVRAYFEQGQLILPNQFTQIQRDVESAIAAVTNFDVRFASLLEDCQRRFSKLSPASRISSALVILYSNLGLLVLAEQLSEALKFGRINFESDIRSKVFHYRITGIASITNMVESMSALPDGDNPEISTESGAGTSIMLDHINLGPVILALTKSTEHSLYLQEAAIENLTAEQVLADPECQSPWGGYIRTLIKCLISLENTIVGAFPARVALDRLLHKHGDTIMEYWFPEYECETQQQLNTRASTPRPQF